MSLTSSNEVLQTSRIYCKERLLYIWQGRISFSGPTRDAVTDAYHLCVLNFLLCELCVDIYFLPK